MQPQSILKFIRMLRIHKCPESVNTTHTFVGGFSSPWATSELRFDQTNTDQDCGVVKMIMKDASSQFNVK